MVFNLGSITNCLQQAPLPSSRHAWPRVKSVQCCLDGGLILKLRQRQNHHKRSNPKHMCLSQLGCRRCALLVFQVRPYWIILVRASSAKCFPPISPVNLPGVLSFSCRWRLAILSGLTNFEGPWAMMYSRVESVTWQCATLVMSKQWAVRQITQYQITLDILLVIHLWIWIHIIFWKHVKPNHLHVHLCLGKINCREVTMNNFIFWFPTTWSMLPSRRLAWQRIMVVPGTRPENLASSMYLSWRDSRVWGSTHGSKVSACFWADSSSCFASKAACFSASGFFPYLRVPGSKMGGGVPNKYMNHQEHNVNYSQHEAYSWLIELRCFSSKSSMRFFHSGP